MDNNTDPIFVNVFNVFHHSSSGANRPNDLQFMEVSIARPAKIFSLANAPMISGKLAETHTKNVLLEQQTETESFRSVLAELQAFKPLSYSEADSKKQDIILNGQYVSDETGDEDTVFALTLKHMLMAVKEAVRGENKVVGGQWASVEMDGLELPYIGELDLMTRGVVELKTQWPFLDKAKTSKRGWKVNSLPAKPKPEHVWQVALYWKWMKNKSDNVPVKLVYANCKSFRIFSSEDCEQLSDASLNDALNHLRVVAKTREKLMKKAGTVKGLLEIVMPDFGHWMWRDKSPEFKQLAEKSWGEVL